MNCTNIYNNLIALVSAAIALIAGAIGVIIASYLTASVGATAGLTVAAVLTVVTTVLVGQILSTFNDYRRCRDNDSDGTNCSISPINNSVTAIFIFMSLAISTFVTLAIITLIPGVGDVVRMTLAIVGLVALINALTMLIALLSMISAYKSCRDSSRTRGAIPPVTGDPSPPVMTTRG